jgi:hypothetical protein
LLLNAIRVAMGRVAATRCVTKFVTPIFPLL